MHINNMMSPSSLAHRTFAIVAAVGGVAMGAGKMIKGGIDKRNARNRQEAAKDQMEKQMDEYMNQ